MHSEIIYQILPIWCLCVLPEVNAAPYLRPTHPGAHNLPVQTIQMFRQSGFADNPDMQIIQTCRKI